ncbi:hypothetical protein AMK92_25805 [Escherichia coli]|nr:hypothetical protein AMK92_25805 [Escherichia coli]
MVCSLLKWSLRDKPAILINPGVVFFNPGIELFSTCKDAQQAMKTTTVSSVVFGRNFSRMKDFSIFRMHQALVRQTFFKT